jgi:(2Fe-2S) ferredoxin
VHSTGYELIYIEIVNAQINKVLQSHLLNGSQLENLPFQTEIKENKF